MPQHFAKATTEASIFCKKCMKETRWRVADGRRQWCIVCYERDHAPRPHAPESAPEEQGNLFSELEART